MDTFLHEILGQHSDVHMHRIGYDEPDVSTPCAMELPWNIATIPTVFASKELQHLDAGQAFVKYMQFLQVYTFAHYIALRHLTADLF